MHTPFMVPIHLLGMPYGAAQFFAVTGKVRAFLSLHSSKIVQKRGLPIGMGLAKCGFALSFSGATKRRQGLK
jgi:hypothetical protein